MYHLDRFSTALVIEAYCDWDEPPWGEGGFDSSNDPERYAILNEFEKDGLVMPIEEFKKKWKIVELIQLGKAGCPGMPFYDRLNNDDQIIQWMEELDVE